MKKIITATLATATIFSATTSHALVGYYIYNYPENEHSEPLKHHYEGVGSFLMVGSGGALLAGIEVGVKGSMHSNARQLKLGILSLMIGVALLDDSNQVVENLGHLSAEAQDCTNQLLETQLDPAVIESIDQALSSAASSFEPLIEDRDQLIESASQHLITSVNEQTGLCSN